MKLRTLLLFWLCSFTLVRGNEIDSLRQVLQQASSDSAAIDALLELSWSYSKLDQDSGVYFAQQALQRSEQSFDAKRKAISLRFMAINYRKKGEYEKSLKALFEALAIEQQRGDHHLAGSTLLGIGNNYYEQNQLALAEKYWMQSFDEYKKAGKEDKASAVLSNLGALKGEQHQYTEALEYYRQSMVIDERLDNQANLAGTMVNMGDIYMHMDSTGNQLQWAQKWFSDGLLLFQKLGDRNGEAAALISMAQLASRQNKLPQAEQYAERALAIYIETSNRIRENECYEILYQLYQKEGRYKEAFAYQNKHLLLKDSLLNELSTRQINELNVLYETAEKEKQLAQQQLEITKQSDEIYRKNIVGIALIVGLTLLVILSIMIFLRFRDKQRANVVISQQKEIVERQNTNIMSSIHYAKNIQHAILPSVEEFTMHFQDSMILYRPKDVVSGDFFWFHKTGEEMILAVADCTGHGVPGAFMSMLGVSLLNEIVIEQRTYETHLILDELREKVIKSLRQRDEKSQNDDGMDISLIKLNCTTGEFQFSGTATPLLIVDGTSATPVYPEFQSISYLPVAQKPFESVQLQLQKNQKLYLTTDGYMDQIGGEKREKIGLTGLTDILLRHHSEPMRVLTTVLDEHVNEWISTGRFKQLDDICIVGIQCDIP